MRRARILARRMPPGYLAAQGSTSQGGLPMEMQTPDSIIRTARQHLATACEALDSEIRAYPTPISGCDAQYNHLLAERRRVHEALQVLEADIHIPTPRAP
jgi:hypothetical protein